MTASPTLDEAPHAAPSPRRPSGPLTFRGPGEDDETPTPWTEAEHMGEGTTSPLDPLGSSPSASGASSDELDEDDESGPRSSRTSSGDSASVRPLTKAAQRAAARQAVKIAGSMVHQYGCRDEHDRAAGLFLVDDESAEQIGDPLARIMARHAPVDGAMANPDVADGIAAMLGFANLIRKQIEAGSHAAAMRAEGAGPKQPADV